MVLSDSDVRALPKVELHCHIEGTMRAAVGLDVTPGMVRLARTRGAPVLRGSVFEDLTGGWGTVLLLDGNIGIGGGRVLLWPDTFNDHFSPQVLRADVEVLEAAGYVVDIPKPVLCCGRPLYDYGFLGLAKRLLERTVDELRDDIRAGVPIVGLEPSCIAVFRDELRNMLPLVEDAERLSKQTFVLSELLTNGAADWRAPSLGDRAAVVQPHCHHRAVMGFEAEEGLLERLGVDAEVLDAGCCGMAGSFGFEASHYEVSMAVGEQGVLPAARATPDSSLLVADGFSCREQIRQATGRTPLHVAEVMAEALRARANSKGTA